MIESVVSFNGSSGGISFGIRRSLGTTAGGAHPRRPSGLHDQRGPIATGCVTGSDNSALINGGYPERAVPGSETGCMNEPIDRNLTPADPEPKAQGSLADEAQQSPGIHP